MFLMGDKHLDRLKRECGCVLGGRKRRNIKIKKKEQTNQTHSHLRRHTHIRTIFGVGKHTTPLKKKSVSFLFLLSLIINRRNN